MPSVSWLALQSIEGSLCPTPRGSIPMMSKCSLSAGNASAPAASKVSAVVPPGPPKLMNNEPIFCPVAGDFATKSLMLWPFGRS